MPRYILKLMGPPSLAAVDEAGAETPTPLSHANLSLLSLVALNAAGASLSRDMVADALWPSASAEKSPSRLSSALWRLHRALGPDAPRLLDGGDGRIGLSPGAGISVDILEVAARTARLRARDPAGWEQPEVAALEAAINRRRGGFLDGFDDDWALAARRRCADIYEEGLEALIRYHRHRGHVDRSIAAARRLVRLDPWREDIQAVLVELYGAKGQRGRAAAQYASCRDALMGDLGIEPGARLSASVAAALGAAAPGAGAPGGDAADVVAMIRTLDRAVDRLARQIGEIHAMLDRGEAPPAARRMKG